MRRTLTALALALATLSIPAAASAVQVEPVDREVNTRKVTYAEPDGGRWAFVELNDGSAYRLKPCKLEDSNHCYWDAGSRGNGAGRSFVALGGKAIYLKKGARVVWP